MAKAQAGICGKYGGHLQMTYKQRAIKPLAERFWAKVQQTDNFHCWNWEGYINPNGYGRIGLGRRADGHEIAHRVSWILHQGPIPKGLCVLHKCDNPTCVNPNHLFLGHQSDNVRDCVKKGRARGGSLKGHFNPNVKLTKRDVGEIRLLYKTGSYFQRELGEIYGVTQAQISSITRGESWS